eukprot:22651-Eustigmatos_ZCMA.PRE.1
MPTSSTRVRVELSIIMQDTLQVRPVALICDFHGHSRREGVFMYSCLPERDPTDGADDPWLLHK